MNQSNDFKSYERMQYKERFTFEKSNLLRNKTYILLKHNELDFNDEFVVEMDKLKKIVSNKNQLDGIPIQNF